MRILYTLTVLGFILIASAAHSQRRGHPSFITVIDDIKVQAFVAIEGRKILAVTKNRNKAKDYQFYLAEFEDRPWAGMASGNHIIYIRYKEARNAHLNRNRQWYFALRRILVHEIAHDILRHPNYRSYSAAQELAADRLGIILWKRLGWDCSFWVWGYENMKERGITDTLHRTDLQLLQAKNLCPEAEDRKREAMNKELRELELLEQQLKQSSPTK
jgi:hypothetical protein